MKDYKVNLGCSGGISVPYLLSGHEGNRHLIAFGVSGYGKSTLIGILEKQLALCDAKILEIDYSESSGGKSTLGEYSRKIDISKDMPCSPFLRRCNLYGYEEDNINYARRLSGVIAGALRLHVGQRNILYSAIKGAVVQYQQISFKKICLELADMEEQTACNLKIRLDYLADMGVFENGHGSWKEIFDNAKPIQVLSLSGFPVGERKIITEMLLEDLKNYITECGTGSNDFFIIIDECQELSFNKDMPVSFFMGEGRKYGCGVWLATQSPGFFKRDELASLLQAGLVINFRPNENERKNILKKITSSDKEYSRLLKLSQELGCGQFIATGAFIRKDGSLSQRTSLIVDSFNADII